MTRRRTSALLCVLAWMVAVFALAPSEVSRASDRPVPEPVVGLTVTWIERNYIAGCHLYSVAMARGEALRILVDQRGVDVAITVEEAAGTPPLVFDGYTGRNGPDGGLFVTTRGGDVSVSVCGDARGATRGGYRIRREELRAATPEARRLEAAFRAYQRGREASDPLVRRRAFEDARDGFRAADAPREEGWAWFQIAVIWEGIARAAEPEWEKAAAAYRAAAALHVAIGDHDQAALLFNNLGRLLQDDLRRVHAALEAFRDQYRWAVEAGNELRAIAALRSQAVCWVDLGHVTEAVATYERAIGAARRVEKPDQEIETLLRLGRLYLNSHDLERALATIGEARQTARKGGFRDLEAQALTRMAEVRLEANQGRLSLMLLQKAESMASPNEAVEARFDRANAFGRAYALTGEAEPARAAYERALHLADTPIRRINVRINWASLLETLGDFEGAVEHCRAATDTAVQVGDGRHTASAYSCIAHNRERQGRLEEALDAIRRAVGEVEHLRTRFAQEDLRVSYFADKQRYFDLYLDLLERLHRRSGDPALVEESFAAVERSKARVLLDGLAAGEERLESEVDPHLLDRREALRRKRVRLLADELRASRDKTASGLPTTIDRRLDRLDSELNTLRGQIFSHRPGWREALSLRPLDLETIRARLLTNGDTQIVTYFLGERAALAWVVGEKTLVLRRLGDPSTIERLADRASRLLALGGTRITLGAAERALDELGREVLEPIAGDLTAGKIILVTGGSLETVPFAGLRLSAGVGSAERLLGQRHRLVQAPSASAAALLGISRERRDPAPLLLAVYADPVYQRDDERVARGRGAVSPDRPESASPTSRGLGLDLASLPRLQGARREAEAIAGMVEDPTRKLVALGFAANREAITGEVLKKYRMIHFGTHGVAEADVSALVLSRWDREGRPMSRYLLEEWEIYDMDLAADLVVLSACRTGRGPLARGEGVLGLARAFLWAGAARVVASLWDVDDEATRHLMVELYRRILVHNDPPAEALQRAQASVQADPRWKSPHFWAGFVLQGDGN